MKDEFKALGTDISIQVVSDTISAELKEEVRNFYKKKEKIFSRFDSESEISELNRKTGRYNAASADMLAVSSKCLEYYQKTENYFDPRVIEVLEGIGYDRNFKDIDLKEENNISFVVENASEMAKKLEDDLRLERGKIFLGRRMDFTGIAKGYITDKVAGLLREKGYRNFLVDSGGDMRSVGRDENGEKWKISLEGVAEEKMLLELNNDFSAIATSGITRRKWENKNGKFHHLINPKNPSEFSFDLKSVTVVAKSCEEADVYAKVLYLMGKEKGMKFSEEKNMKSLFLDYKSNVYMSTKIKDNIIKTHA